jgi:predicted DCC family thiol-disulfide oxidoreductase YuxK
MALDLDVLLVVMSSTVRIAVLGHIGLKKGFLYADRLRLETEGDAPVNRSGLAVSQAVGPLRFSSASARRAVPLGVPDESAPILVYDGDCAFCTRAVAFALSQMKVVCQAVPWQQADLPKLGLTPEEATEAVWWVEAGGVKARGHRAVAAALRHGRPGARPVGRLLEAPLLDNLAAAGYDLVARNRHRLPGGSAACVADPDRDPDPTSR